MNQQADLKTNLQTMRAILHKQDPYVDFDYQSYPLRLQGWAPAPAAFDEIIQEFCPQSIIEVGTWMGLSATRFVQAMRDAGIGGHVLCIDTWLGAREMWDDGTSSDSYGLVQRDVDGRYDALALKNGYPQLYYQFLANVRHSEMQESITPFPQTSAIAARLLRSYGVQADLVYIDGSHDYEDVLADLKAYWPLVRPGGILMGDDLGWAGVRQAVREFTTERGLTIREHPNQIWWTLTKEK